jgi:hypothetical protein
VLIVHGKFYKCNGLRLPAYRRVKSGTCDLIAAISKTLTNLPAINCYKLNENTTY